MSDETAARPRVSAYAWYALILFVIVYIFNFIDRQIVSILAESIKADLELDDAQIGFLYGTAFAVFYALFGIPLGRLADSWYRGRLMEDRKSTRLNSSHANISYAVFCLKKI